MAELETKLRNVRESMEKEAETEARNKIKKETEQKVIMEA